jgi:hypothetical protein
MERERFDQVARLIGKAGTRRSALRLAATAALLGGTAAFDGVAAKGRKKRDKVRSDAESPPCIGNNTPSICLVTGGTGCGQPDGNCANKKIGPGTNLTNCNFINENGDIFQTNFAAANLTGTCWFAESLFNHANFRGANLTNACFFETNLDFSDFRGANLTGASFCLADLTGVDFRGSNLTAAQLAQATTVTCSTILPNGKSAKPCDKGLTCCIDICTDTDTDPDNCGTCGNVCTPPQNCDQGSCGVG